MMWHVHLTGAHNESSVLRRQERDTPTHLIKNCKSTHDGRVSKNRLVMADGTRTSVSYWLELDSQRLLGGRQQLVEALYTSDDSQMIAMCTHSSCREAA